MIARLLIGACIACAAVPTPGFSEEKSYHVLRGVVPKSYSVRPPLSGYLATWVKVTVVHGKKDLDFLMPYMTSDQSLPPIGGNCIFTYHIADVDGLVGQSPAILASARILEEFSCKSEAEAGS